MTTEADPSEFFVRGEFTPLGQLVLCLLSHRNFHEPGFVEIRLPAVFANAFTNRLCLRLLELGFATERTDERGILTAATRSLRDFFEGPLATHCALLQLDDG